MTTNISVIKVDYDNASHTGDLLRLLALYAADPAGGGEPLPARVFDHLIEQLAQFPTAFSLLAYADGDAAGFCNCFFGFSTFSCQKLINIHDLAVVPSWRGYGISQQLLDSVERVAVAEDCCKLTLEVLEGNAVALSAYQKFGFQPYQLADGFGQALFLNKMLS